MRIRLNMSYDGTGFRGWQVQSEGTTLQGELERALQQFYGGESIRTIASGRTDAGVHAIMQVIHYDAPVERDHEKIIRGLNSLLPDDMQIWHARTEANDFHARFSARKRVYAYRLLRSNDLFLRRYGWYAGPEFSLDKATDVAGMFLGKHDFRAFSTQPDPDESTVCDVQNIRWREDEHGWILVIEADRFIRRLVRTLTGAIVAMVNTAADIDEISNVIAGGSGRVPPPAPPQGLALARVFYEDDRPEDTPPTSLWGTFTQSES